MLWSHLSKIPAGRCSSVFFLNVSFAQKSRYSDILFRVFSCWFIFPRTPRSLSDLSQKHLEGQAHNNFYDTCTFLCYIYSAVKKLFCKYQFLPPAPDDPSGAAEEVIHFSFFLWANLKPVATPRCLDQQCLRDPSWPELCCLQATLIGQEKKKKPTCIGLKTTAVDLNWVKGPHWTGRLAGSVWVEGIKCCEAAQTLRLLSELLAVSPVLALFCPLQDLEKKKKKTSRI